MSSDYVLEVCHVTKTFRIFSKPSDHLRELLFRKKLYQELVAVRDATFSLKKGEIMGIIGQNGSGKSTTLKLVAGVLVPDCGTIAANGKIAGLLELGTGFNVELSGRRNIYLNGVYLGMRKSELEACEDAIIEFSELENFIDAPLRTYSSGMVMRLAFAIAIHSRPACFIIDEALSVGDVRFQQKCFKRLEEFRGAGGSILFVSHDINAIKLICDSVMVMEHGVTRFHGDPEEAVNVYNEILADRGDSGQNTRTGYGNGDVQFTGVEVENTAGEKMKVVTCGQPLVIHFTWECRKKLEQVTFGFMIRDRFGQDVFGTNGAFVGNMVDIEGSGDGHFTIKGMNIGAGLYTVNLAAHSGLTHEGTCYHWWDNAASFEVIFDETCYFCGHTRLDASLRVESATCRNSIL